MSEENTGAFLSAEWRHLLLANFEIDPGVLTPFIPGGTELDSFENKHYVSLVGFMFLGTRMFGKIPVPFHRNFEEVNLRFYVKRRVGDESRRGVVFIKEIVPRFAIALIARRIYGEKYISLPMDHRVDLASSSLKLGGRISYSFKTKEKWNYFGGVCAASPAYPTPGSKEQFIIEHYYGYTQQPDGKSLEYRVEHPEWRVMNVKDFKQDLDVEKAYGKEFVSCLSATPASVFAAEGSPIIVRRGTEIPPGT